MCPKRLACLVVTIVLPALAADDKKPGTKSISSSGTSVAGSGENAYGLSSASLLSIDSRPVACYGLTKGRKQKDAYSYFILFKMPADDDSKETEFGFNGGESMTGNAITAKESPVLTYMKGNKKWSFTYQLEANDDLTKVKRETITIDGKEYKTVETAVFLVDLSGDKPTCKAIKAAMPKSIPKVSGKDDTIGVVGKAIEELTASSVEVKEFLKADPKK